MPGPCDSPVVSTTETYTLSGPSFFEKQILSGFLNIYHWVFLMQAIRFFMSSNLTIKGLKIKNSPQFHFRFDACHGVRVESLTIKAPAQSPNTDGIHIENTNNVQIYNSIISNGEFSYKMTHGHTYNQNIVLTTL